jgi:replication factor A1
MYQDDTTPGSVVQVLDIKRLNANNNSQSERYRLVVSDSLHYQQSMVATQLNSMIVNDEIKKFSIIKLNEIICNVVQNRRIIIILGLEVVSEPVEKLGDPKNVDTAVPSQSSFAGNTTQPAPAPAPEAKPVMNQPTYNKSTPPVQQNANMGNVVPINSLNPYQNKWTIKAQVSQKSQIRTWNNAKGEGKLFSMTLRDDQGGEIRCTMFKEGVDKYYDMLEDGKTYTFSRGQLKPANQRYNTCQNDYEMTLSGDTEIQYCSETIKVKLSYTFVDIKNLQDTPVQSNVDICGVVKQVGEISSIATKRGDTVDKRNITLIDDSEAAIDITLWGDKAQKWEAQEGSVVAMKSLKVGDYNGRSLSASYGTLTELNPDIPRAADVMAWYQQTGGQAVESLTKAGGGGGPAPRKTLKQVKEEGLGMGEKPDYVEVKAFVTFIKHDSSYFYVACPETNKKCIEQGEGSWICEANGKTYTNDQILRRYIMSVTTNDNTGSQWLTAFDEAGKTLLNAPANTMFERQTQKDPAFEGAFAEACFKEYLFKLRCKQETYNDETRLKCMIQSVSPVNFASESSSMLSSIKEMLGQA